MPLCTQGNDDSPLTRPVDRDPRSQDKFQQRKRMDSSVKVTSYRPTRASIALFLTTSFLHSSALTIHLYRPSVHDPLSPPPHIFLHTTKFFFIPLSGITVSTFPPRHVSPFRFRTLLLPRYFSSTPSTSSLSSPLAFSSRFPLHSFSLSLSLSRFQFFHPRRPAHA